MLKLLAFAGVTQLSFIKLKGQLNLAADEFRNYARKE